MSDKDTGKAMAIQKNIAKKKEREKKGDICLKASEFAQALANRDKELSPGMEDAFWRFMEFVETGKDDTTMTDFSKVVGSLGGDGKRKQPYGWYRNLLIIFSAGLIIDFRNRRAMDFQTRQVIDYSSRQIRSMSETEINSLFKGGDK